MVYIDSPGFNMNFESAPFKLTKEYVELLGGIDSPLYHMFEELFVKGFLVLQQHVEEIVSIIQVLCFIMMFLMCLSHVFVVWCF